MELLDVIKGTGGISAIAEQLGQREPGSDRAAALCRRRCAFISMHGCGLEVSLDAGAAAPAAHMGSQRADPHQSVATCSAYLGSKDVSRESRAGPGTPPQRHRSIRLPIWSDRRRRAASRTQSAGAGGLLDQLGGLLGGSGGAGGLGKLLDQDGNGNPLDDVLRSAGKIFGR